MRLFAERGFTATRVEDIVDAAGYTRGAFYFHFENKLDCFWAVAAYREQLRGDWVSHVTAGVDPNTLSLEEILARTFAHSACDGFQLCAFFASSTSVSGPVHSAVTPIPCRISHTVSTSTIRGIRLSTTG